MGEYISAVLDTNILTHSLLDYNNIGIPIFEFIEHGNILMYVTPAIKNEYHRVFNREKTDNNVPILESHRIKLQELLQYSVLLKNLLNLNTLNCVDPEDLKFIYAAVTVARIEGSCYLVSDDHHLTNLQNGLFAMNVLVENSREFVNSL